MKTEINLYTCTSPKFSDILWLYSGGDLGGTAGQSPKKIWGGGRPMYMSSQIFWVLLSAARRSTMYYVSIKTMS